MAHDWVQGYMQGRLIRQQRDQDERIKAQHALAGAAKAFERLREQIQKDIAAFHQGGGDSRLSYQEVSTLQLRVRRAAYPAVTLEVELNSTTIHFERDCKYDDTSRPETIRGSFRIWANLAGDVQIYKNGAPFLDESEVSELLLEPVFTYMG